MRYNAKILIIGNFLPIPSSYLGGGDAEVLADVTAQVSRGREIETEGDVGKGQRTVVQKAGYFHRSITVDPIRCAAADDGFAGLGEVFGRDTEAVGIIGNVAVRAVLAALQHLNKTVHEVRVRVAQVVLLVVYMRMEIKEIDDHALHGVERQVQIETVVSLRTTGAHVFHVFFAPRLLLRVEVHDRVVEQHHVSARAVVAERHRHLDKLRRDVDGNGSEVLTCTGYLRRLAALHDDTIAGVQGMRRAVEQQRCRALQTERVRQVTRVGELQFRR